MRDRPSVVRQAGLLAVVFVATFVLLAGGRALLGRAAASRVPSPPVASVVTGAGPSAVAGPSASPAGSGEATIVLTGAGDIADCTLEGAARTSDLLVGQPGSIFTAGDNAYEDGSPANFTDCYAPTWGRVLDRTILPTAGNHDWVTAGAAGYLGYFGAAAAPKGVTWYSMDLAAWHVIVLDSDCANVGGCDAGSPQGQWLKKDLADSTAHCTLAIWHHPRFSSGEHGNDPEVAPFWDQLHAAGAELVINGHDHDYERFAPQDPSGKVERPGGLREIVVGTGGAVLRSFKAQAANSEFRSAGVWGVLQLTLRPINYEWKFLPVGSPIADSGSTPCH
jgi:hypothetical protein